MSTTADFGRLPLSEQLRFFRRKLNLPTAAYTDVYGAEHDRVFMVAGAAKIDLLQDFRNAVEATIEKGEDLRDFRKRFDTIVDQHGWVYNGGRNWRSRVIYETNLRASYGAGRYQQLQAVKRFRPYWQYVHQDGERHPRPLHESWGGLVLHADDPWWSEHYPPGGYGCKCTVHSLADDDLADLGKTAPDATPETEYEDVTLGKRTGNPRTVRTAKGIDPGFGHLQGKTSLGAEAERYIHKTALLPPKIAAQAVLGAVSRKRILAGLQAEFVDWLKHVDRAHTRNDFFAVGAITPRLLQKLSGSGTDPETAAILVRDVEAAHALRDAKANRTTATGLPKSLSVDEFAQIPRLLAEPRAVLLDHADGSLIYVFDPPQRSAGLVVVRVDFRGKLAKIGKATFNTVKTTSLTETYNLQAQVDSGALVLLEGKL